MQATSGACLICTRALSTRRPRGRKVCSSARCASALRRILAAAEPRCAICDGPLRERELLDRACRTEACARALRDDPGRALCPFCNRALTTDDDVCSLASCRAAAEVAAALAAGRAELERRRAELAARVAIEPTRLPIVSVPANSRPLVPVATDRVASFRAHLEQLAADLSAAVDPDPRTPRPTPTLTSHDAAQLDRELAICTLCAGECCVPGGARSAFVDRPLLLRYRAAHPAASATEVIAAYIGAIPAEAYQGSCLYHGAAGCGLPREMRSDVCNDHLCRGLADYREAHRTGQPAEVPVYVAAATPDAIQRDALVLATGELRRRDPTGAP